MTGTIFPSSVSCARTSRSALLGAVVNETILWLVNRVSTTAARMGPIGPAQRLVPTYDSNSVPVAVSARRRADSEWLPTRSRMTSYIRRVLRIQSEFIEGFDALAGIGPAVTIFGSARVVDLLMRPVVDEPGSP